MKSVQPSLTLAAFLRMPETEPASEYCDGKVVKKVSPGGKHSHLQTRLAERLSRRSLPRKIGCAFCECRCTFGGRSIVPDVVFLRWERIPRDSEGEIDEVIRCAPDMTVEIPSAGQSIGRLEEKLEFSVRNGVLLGWLIIPAKRVIKVYRPDRPPEIVASGKLDAAPLLPDLDLTAEEIFGWLSFGT